ncbi:P-loop containing nucleoside triphosphate hydrolase protein [Schizophyllum amplum]|uniref:P-loop containing nucleoside triphosphate hydrolase protein n=1 Tax=Schizophyllum amplum TaxID=97359 RepID=A0A550CED2_9AGAR|nr:P-loop containing nucleoside triphosphate hydrolase protein [Auriculariopsis ampla]
MAPSADSFKKRKIAVLGSRSVGKSSLVGQFIDNEFKESYYPTIESSHQKTVKHNGAEYMLNIIDTAGQDEYSPLNSQHAIGIHGYVLVYSITSRNTLEMVKIVYEKIIDFCGVTDIPCVIVGAKSDLTQSRQVDSIEAEKTAHEMNAAWVETSAKNNVNVDKVFDLCLGEIEKRTSPTQSEPPTKSCTVM